MPRVLAISISEWPSATSLRQSISRPDRPRRRNRKVAKAPKRTHACEEALADQGERRALIVSQSSRMANEADKSVTRSSARNRHRQSLGPAVLSNQPQGVASDLRQLAIPPEFAPAEWPVAKLKGVEQRIALNKAGIDVKIPPAFGPLDNVKNVAVPVRNIDLSARESIKAERLDNGFEQRRA